MKFRLKRWNHNLSDEELIADVVRVANELGVNSISSDTYGEKGKYSSSTFRRFSSWHVVLERAGLQPCRQKYNASNEDLFDNLAEVWIRLGRQPRFHECKRPISKYSGNRYSASFGSWRNALEQFVEFMADDSGVLQDENVGLELFEDNKKSPAPVRHRTKQAISDRLRFRILMRDGFTCQSCGASPIKTRDVELHVDHIIPWSEGGETEESNLQTKCRKCNLGKGNAFKG